MSKKNNPHYKGEPTPKHLQHGPVDDRRCTDIICLIVFLISWGGIIAVAIYSFHNGTPMDLTYVFDQYDRPCGIGNQSAYPYLFFNASFTDDSDWSFSPSSTVCVQQCPDNYNETVLCLPDPSDSDANCTGIYSYSSTIFIDRFCVPTNAVLLGDLYNASVFSANFFYQNMSDLQKTWWMMIVVALFALIFGFLYLFLMRHFAGALLWGLIACFVLILVAFGIICLEDATGSTDLTAITPANLTRIDPLVLYLIAVACFLVAFITIVVICCFRTRINLSIAVLKAAADFIEEEKGTLIIPPLMFIKSVVFYIFWIFVLIFIIGTNTYVPDEDHYPIGDLQWNSKAIGMLIYHIFALFWNHCFGVALSQFIIASAACLWYFTQGRSNMRKPVVWTSFKRSFLHMGSIALGSFLISVLGFIRLIIDFFNRRLNKESAQGEEKGFCLSCCACCFKCFELCLKFISRHAYIQIAMTGEGFCKATEEAYYLLARNAVRFGLVHGLAWLFLFIGQLFITLLSAFLGYIIITKDSTFSNNIYSPVGPTILFFLISWLVADVFMAIYGVSADTIIHCFAMDEEIHDGIAEHAPKDLRDFINGNLHQKLLPDE